MQQNLGRHLQQLLLVMLAQTLLSASLLGGEAQRVALATIGLHHHHSVALVFARFLYRNNSWAIHRVGVWFVRLVGVWCSAPSGSQLGE